MRGEPERGQLERSLQKPRSEWTVDELARFAIDRKLSLLSLMHVGGDGCLRTLDFLPRGQGHWRDLMMEGERADGSSLFAGMESGASDVLLRPRPETAFLDPFSPAPTLVLMAGHADPERNPLPQSPDTILSRAVFLLERDLGLRLRALGEVEFFLGRPAALRRSPPEARGYHAASPQVFGEALRREALVTLSEMGIPLKYAHSEVGFIEASEPEGLDWEQHEIELALAPLEQAAWAVVLTRWVLESLAQTHGLQCSFEPIVQEGKAGNGLHFHLYPEGGGRSAPPVAADGTLSPPAQWLISGLVEYGGALMAFGNRSEASYVRLRQAKEAPNSLTWGFYDRQALIRIPVAATDVRGNGSSPRTIEFRLPDGSAHPYFLLAGVVQALRQGSRHPDLEGLLARTRSRVARSSAEGAVALPATPAEVATNLTDHRAVLEAEDVFPPGVIDPILHALGS